MADQVELLTEIRDLLLLMAEPALAKRDATLREALRKTVGTGRKKAAAALLMDGSRSKVELANQSGIDNGNLSRLVKELTEAKLIGPDQKLPRLVIKIAPNFFEESAKNV